MESFLWKDSDAYKLFSYLIMKANHKDTEFLFNGKKQTLKRGQMICGRKQLSEETYISESKIYRTMEILENEHLIIQQKTNRYTIVSIVNYEEHQENEHQNEQLKTDKVNIPVNIPVNTSKTLKRIKKNNNIGIDPQTSQTKVFIDWWYQQHLAKFNKPYFVQGGKDGSLVKNILDKMTLVEAKRLAEAFFESEDSFVLKAGYTIGVFNSQINKLITATAEVEDSTPHNGFED